MKTLGIDINGNTAVFCAIEENGGIADITGKMTKLELKDDESSQEVHEFVDVVHSHLNEMKFDKIGILKRAKSLKENSVRVIMICGEQDKNFYAGQQELSRLLDSANVENRFIKYPNLGHGFPDDFNIQINQGLKNILNSK